MRFTSFAAIAALASTALAAPAQLERHVLHEKRDSSRNWIKRDRVDSQVTLPVRIGLVQSNLDRGYEYLNEV